METEDEGHDEGGEEMNSRQETIREELQGLIRQHAEVTRELECYEKRGGKLISDYDRARLHKIEKRMAAIKNELADPGAMEKRNSTYRKDEM